MLAHPIGSLYPLGAKRAAAPRAITLRIAIVIAGLLIGAAILITFRWEIRASLGFVYQLDRWSGHTVVCGATGDPADCREIPFGR